MSGFPDGTSSRELNNLVRFLPGYEACSVSAAKEGAGGGGSLFVLFRSATAALAARDALAGKPFDEADASGAAGVLRVEVAKRNMRAAQSLTPRV